MKAIGFFFSFLLTFNTYAQLISSPRAYKSLTEEQFYTVFGSVKAYNLEEGLKFNSSHHRQVMLIGAKLWWLQEIPHYMVEQLACSNHVDSDNEPIHSHFKIYPGGVLTREDDGRAVDISCTFDDSLHVRNVKMTGNTHLLIQLFLWYWENSDIKFNKDQFKKGVLFYENSGSDRICFNWKSTKPVISITKNPLFPTPLPLIAERSGD